GLRVLRLHDHVVTVESHPHIEVGAPLFAEARSRCVLLVEQLVVALTCRIAPRALFHRPSADRATVMLEKTLVAGLLACLLPQLFVEFLTHGRPSRRMNT